MVTFVPATPDSELIPWSNPPRSRFDVPFNVTALFTDNVFVAPPFSVPELLTVVVPL